MAALTTLLAVASVAVGVAGTAVAAKQNKAALRQSQENFDTQQTQATEAGKVKSFKDSAGAKFKLGTSDYGLTRGDTVKTPQSAANTNSGNLAGGLTPTASQVGGL